MIACLSVHNSTLRYISGRRTFVVRSTYVLSVPYAVHVRFIRYVSVTRTVKSVTRTLKSVACPLLVRYMFGTRTVFIRFKPIAGASSSAGVDFYQRTTNGLRFLAVLLSVGRPFALSGKV